MSYYLVMIGICGHANPRDQADSHWRKNSLFELIFQLGPAWHGSQGSIILRSKLTRAEIVERISPLVRDVDFVGVLEIDAKSITTIGYNSDEEGLDRLYENVLKVAAPPSSGLT
jgi:hypothetical protein